MKDLLLKKIYELRRNPSNVQFLLLIIIVLLIIYILFGNQIINTAKNNLETTLKNRNEREFSGDIDVEAWQYSWIRTGIINMKNAQGPAQWRAINWDKGCHSRRITKWNEIYQNTIQESCKKLNVIQKEYDNYCLGVNENCQIPKIAFIELTEVMNNLEEAFSNAGFVSPYNELEETGIE